MINVIKITRLFKTSLNVLKLKIQNMSKLVNTNPEVWTKIGTLKQIYIYPVDTGYGIGIGKASCTNNGLQSYYQNRKSGIDAIANDRYKRKRMRIADHLKEIVFRTLVAFSLSKNCNTEAILYNPKIAADLKMQELIDIQADGASFKDTFKILYIGDEMNLRDTLHEISLHNNLYAILSSAVKKSTTKNKKIEKKDRKAYKIGYISQKDRKEFINRIKPTLEKDMHPYLLSNYSSYTLINSKSLDFVKKENINCPNNISEKKFRPHLVIEAVKPYIEDLITALKVGLQAEFSNVTPCTHNFMEVISTELGDEIIRQDELFKVLQRTRSLAVLHPHLFASKSSLINNLPAFGINLEIHKPGDIMIDNTVYVKFRNTVTGI